MLLRSLAPLALLAAPALADVPTNCMIEEVFGSWTFKLSTPVKTLNCSSHYSEDTVDKTITMELQPPNLVVDENGLGGWFTMIYNQGFQVFIGGHSYFAFFHWEGKLPYLTTADPDSSYDCTKTMPGWAHNLVGQDHRCFLAEKDTGANDLLSANKEQDNEQEFTKPASASFSSAQAALDRPFAVDRELLNRLEMVPKSVKTWTSSDYSDLWNETMTIRQAKRFQGPFRSELKKLSLDQAQKSEHPEKISAPYRTFNHDKEIPDEFDWRNVDGVNFVSPVRHQDMCGSCYIFASAGELEARIRIATNNVKQPVLSTQQPVDCSPYSQGCSGGFPFLIAGKWAHDFGFVDEECYPYEGKDATCRDPELAPYMQSYDANQQDFFDYSKTESGESCFKNRYYSWMYRYVGNYFGNCDAEKMKEEVFKFGPVAVGFEVLDDFRYYKEGIYQHTGLQSITNKVGKGFDVTNHAVLVVGYGHCNKENLDYWIVKNSWGEKWGMGGYFKIVRGRDEVGIESMAQGSFVVPPY